jgi:hypothetical protein
LVAWRTRLQCNIIDRVFQRFRRPAEAGAVSEPAPSLGSALVRFMLASLAAMLVIVVGAFFALRQVAIDQAERDTRERVQAEARLVEAAGLRDEILRGSPSAIRRLDDVVLGQIVSGSMDELRPDAAGVQAAIQNGGAGSGAMPKGLAQGEEAAQIADFVSKAAGG